QHDAAARAHYHIVRPVQDVDAGRFEDQGQGLQGGIIHKYLPEPHVPAICRQEVELACGKPATFEAPESGSSRIQTLLEDGRGVGSGSPTGTQLTGKGKPGLWPMAVSNPEEVSTLSISRFPPGSAGSGGGGGGR